MDDGDTIYNGLYFDEFETLEEAEKYVEENDDTCVYIAKVIK